MNSKDTLIQKAVSRKDSLRIQLSHESWKNGIANFFLNGIPFSFSTGLYYAKQLCELYDYLMTDNTDEECYVYELGSGTGLLSKHFLDHLKKTNTALYKKTKLILSDYSRDQIKEKQSKLLFKSHLDRITFQVTDFLDIKKLSPKAHFIYFSYLIDSTDCHHFAYNNKKLYELLVESSVPDDYTLMDTTLFPPKFIGYKEAIKLVKEKSNPRKRLISQNLSGEIIERYTKIPLSKSKISKENKTLLKRLIQNADPKKDTVFNAHFKAYDSIKALLSSMDDSGAIVILDFGNHSLQNVLEEKELLASYGSTTFTSISFELLQFATSKAENTITTKHNCGNNPDEQAGSTQSIIIRKSKLSKDLKKRVQNSFGNCHSSPTEIVQKKIESLGEKKTLSKNARQRKRKDYLSSLSEEAQKDYSLSVALAKHLIDCKEQKESLSLIKDSCEEYGPIGIPFYILQGIAYHGLDKIADSKKAFEEALHHSNNNSPDAQLGLSLNYLVEKDIGNYIKSATEFLKTNLRASPWRTLITILDILSQLPNKNNYNEFKDWFIQTIKEHPKKVPQDIKEIFKS